MNVGSRPFGVRIDLGLSGKLLREFRHVAVNDTEDLRRRSDYITVGFLGFLTIQSVVEGGHKELMDTFRSYSTDSESNKTTIGLGRWQTFIAKCPTNDNVNEYVQQNGMYVPFRESALLQLNSVSRKGTYIPFC